jgi:hypothetical protein
MLEIASNDVILAIFFAASETRRRDSLDAYGPRRRLPSRSKMNDRARLRDGSGDDAELDLL